jgi:alanine racemase
MQFSSIRYVHISASAGTFYSSFTPGNVARLGLSLYGIKANPKADLDLKPAMQIESQISSVKEIGPSEGVGYNLTYRTPAQAKIATVPMGYYEGVDRRLSNLGFYSVGGVACPIVGRVSMNITSTDVSAVPNVKLGDPVVVLSANPVDANSVENIAKQIKTIPYEILVHIPQSLRRVIVETL